MLLAHIYGFGTKGCYQSNQTLAKIFMVSPCTISRWIAGLGEYLYFKSPKGYYRTLWAKCHPAVADKSFFASKQDKKRPVNLGKSADSVERNRGSDLSKPAAGLRRDCATTNNKTNKETTKATTPPPSLAAGGQPSAVLEDRQAQMQAKADAFKRSFGSGRKRAGARLTTQQFEQRRQKALKALLAGSSLKS